MLIYCCACRNKTEAHLTDGSEIYPHREDLWQLPFWRCGICKNFVGCHHKTKNRTAPLGNIPTPELRNARQKIHALLDPIWKNRILSRKEIYKKISDKIGWQYHTAFIRDIEEARTIYKIILEIKNDRRNS